MAQVPQNKGRTEDPVTMSSEVASATEYKVLAAVWYLLVIAVVGFDL